MIGFLALPLLPISVLCMLIDGDPTPRDCWEAFVAWCRLLRGWRKQP